MENYLFEKMSVPKAYMKLALPVVLSMIVSLVYNMVDTYFIALTGGTGRRSVTRSTDVYLNDRIWRYLRTWRKFRDFKIVRREER